MRTPISRPLLNLSIAAVLAAASCLSPAWAQGAAATSAKPTVVLVHGAFAESSSWNGVASRLLAKGYGVVAVANP
jgi:alpha-beta hydrolase superfamily lysophospholipase